MSGQITRRLKPEEEEILRKQEELRAIRIILAERELEIVDFRTKLAVFEGRYLRQVGTIYAELDEWRARISELQANLHPSDKTAAGAAEAREQAEKTYEAAHGAASQVPDFTPSPDLKRLYREAARQIHPDFAMDAADLERRTRFMAEANRAYEAGDAKALQRILNEYQAGLEGLGPEGVGAELIRIIRQISLAKERLAAIEKDLAAMKQSEIALLMKQAEDRHLEGRDLLAELAAAVREKVERSRNEYMAFAKQAEPRE